MLSLDLYKNLINNIDDVVEYITFETFPTQFQLKEFNYDCYSKIYLKKDMGINKRQDYFKLIKNLESTCKDCWKFYLNPRNKSIKGMDIQLGKKFQEKLCNFLNEKEIICAEGDIKNKIYPDNLVKDINGDKKAYLEIKYQSAPWIFAYREKDTNRECYEGSPAIDIKKLENQWNLVENGEIKVPIYYVFWLDFPCIKGVFFMDIRDLYNYYKSEATVFDRRLREGDFEKKKDGIRKVGYTKKIHPSIYQMGSFEELINILGE
jgi:hypothetical protein